LLWSNIQVQWSPVGLHNSYFFFWKFGCGVHWSLPSSSGLYKELWGSEKYRDFGWNFARLRILSARLSLDYHWTGAKHSMDITGLHQTFIRHWLNLGLFEKFQQKSTKISLDKLSPARVVGDC
jgi:hypothetical protein